jgi:hypothetical protein
MYEGGSLYSPKWSHSRLARCQGSRLLNQLLDYTCTRPSLLLRRLADLVAWHGHQIADIVENDITVHMGSGEWRKLFKGIRTSQTHH